MSESSPLTAQVIPCLRLPRSLDVFDYLVPDSLRASIQVGSVVRIRFRKQRILGIVTTLTEGQSAQATKAIDGCISGFVSTSIQIRLMREMSGSFFVSPGTLANMMWGELPRNWRGPELRSAEVKARPHEAPSLLWTSDRRFTIEYVKKHIAADFSSKQTTLLLAPEIRTVKNWAEELADVRPLVIHKQLPRQLYWDRIAQLNRQGSETGLVVISTRSALFFPWPNLDSIIIDQEENPHHRQSEMNPRFHSTQVAEILSRSNGSRLLLTSTVPLLTSYHQCRSESWKLIDKRSPAPKPIILRVDMRDERKVGNFSMLSEKLQLEIRDLLGRHKRCVLFLNRKGEANALSCQDCGRGFPCPRCQKALVPHRRPKQAEELVCHLCGHSETVPASCPTCESTRFSRSGWRLQKLRDELTRIFPDASVALLETASPTSSSLRSDIVIGTQLILRPEFLESADLLAAILADQLLAFPDFSSPERTFRMLTQAALDMKPGSRFIIQTFQPEHPAIALAGSFRWDDFYKQEIKERKLFSYPPHRQLLRLIRKGENKSSLAKEAEELFQKLEAEIPKDSGIILHHPNPGFIAKTRGQYRWEMVLKYPISQWTKVQKLVHYSNEKWLIDVNPLDLL